MSQQPEEQPFEDIGVSHPEEQHLGAHEDGETNVKAVQSIADSLKDFSNFGHGSGDKQNDDQPASYQELINSASQGSAEAKEGPAAEIIRDDPVLCHEDPNQNSVIEEVVVDNRQDEARNSNASYGGPPRQSEAASQVSQAQS